MQQAVRVGRRQHSMAVSGERVHVCTRAPLWAGTLADSRMLLLALEARPPSL